MVIKFGKFFKKSFTNEISCFQYDINQNYYTLIREKQKEGFTQCIITSNIMIEIMEYFISEGNSIISIEFMVEDAEIENKINFIVESMKNNSNYWDILKNEILFLSQNDCIEVKKIEFKNNNKSEYTFSILVNGIVIIPEDKFNSISKKISTIIEREII